MLYYDDMMRCMKILNGKRVKMLQWVNPHRKIQDEVTGISSTEKPWFRVKNSCTVNVNSDRISTKCLHRRQLESVPLPSKTTLHGFYYTDSPLSFVFVKWGNAIGGYHHFFLILSTVKYLHRSQHNFICNLVMLYTLFFGVATGNWIFKWITRLSYFV